MSKGKTDNIKAGPVISDDSSPEFLIEDRFRVIKKLGKGGMGEIFLVEDSRLKRKVAVKRISKENLEDKDSKIRFLREAQTASQIEHPNICPIYEIYEEESNNYIIMQYIDGVSLDSIIKYQDLDLKKILGISIQICDGMIEAHSVGIIHRDLKPGNVMVDKKGNVKLLDFGLAKFRDESDTRKHGISNSNLTEKGIVIGTVSYMSPEQARGEPLDFRNDIFSFGLILFEMLEGYNPFFDNEQITTLYNVLNKDPKFKDNIDEDLKRVVIRCLEKKREDRYSSFEEIKNDLEKIKDNIDPKKEERYQSGRTEIIELPEKEEILKKIEQSSSAEELGDLVYRIKKIKTETVPVVSTRRWFKKRSIILSIIAALAAVAIFMAGFFNSKRGGYKKNEINYILLKELNGEVPGSFKDMAKFLISEALISKKNIKVISSGNLNALKKSEKEPVSDEEFMKKNMIKFSISGNISRFSNIYNFDLVLEDLKTGKKSSITTPGLDSDNSLLNYQINNIAVRVLKKITGEESEVRLQDVFGENMSEFRNFFNGLKEYKKLNIARAKNFFKKTPGIRLSNYYLANLYFFNGDRIRAKNLLQKIKTESGSIPAMYRLKILSLKARLDMDLANEIRYLMKLKNLNPLDKEASFEIGEAFFHRGDAPNALKYYKYALDLDSEYSKALNHLGYCYSYLGDHDRSLESFESYRDLDKSANSFDSLGDGFFYSGDMLSSQAAKQTALKIDKKGTYWAYLTLADIYLLKKKYDESLKAADNYINTSSESYEKADGLSKKAFIMYKKGDYKKAYSLIENALSIYDSSDINNESSEEHWIKGLILIKKGDFKSADKELIWLRKIVQKNSLSEQNFKQPLKYFLHLDSEIKGLRNSMESAEKSFRSLLSLKYRLSYWITMYNQQFFKTRFASFLLNLGRVEESMKEINDCLKLGEKYLPALELKLMILKQSGKIDEAKLIENTILSLRSA